MPVKQGNLPKKTCWKVSDKKVHDSHINTEVPGYSWCPGYSKKERDGSAK